VCSFFDILWLRHDENHDIPRFVNLIIGMTTGTSLGHDGIQMPNKLIKTPIMIDAASDLTMKCFIGSLYN